MAGLEHLLKEPVKKDYYSSIMEEVKKQRVQAPGQKGSFRQPRRMPRRRVAREQDEFDRQLIDLARAVSDPFTLINREITSASSLT